jgi:hypothetical protein
MFRGFNCELSFLSFPKAKVQKKSETEKTFYVFFSKKITRTMMMTITTQMDAQEQEESHLAI